MFLINKLCFFPHSLLSNREYEGAKIRENWFLIACERGFQKVGAPTCSRPQLLLRLKRIAEKRTSTGPEST